MRNNKKILLVQLFSNGDCLYATTIARQIKQDFPGSVLTWAVAASCKNILAGNPYVDDIMIVNDVPKNDVPAFRRLKKRLKQAKKKAEWDEVFITHNMDSNQALYDGTIRGMIFRAYPFPVTVPVQPVVVLNETEKSNVAAFASKHSLESFEHIILWEYAPQSGQALLHFDFVMQLAERITAIGSTCVILSSANAFQSTANIIDASPLTIRENAALTHYCSLLIGCSSGITWLSTSSAAKFLPMLQLLDPQAYFLNAPSVDFKRYAIPSDGLIEIIHIEEEKIYSCIKSILSGGVAAAKLQYNETLPQQFNTTRKIVYNLLCYLQFGAIAKHYRIMTSVFGHKRSFYEALLMAILEFPFRLFRNLMYKHVIKPPGAQSNRASRGY